MPPIRVNIVSESGNFEAQGVHTAFVDMVEALRKRGMDFSRLGVAASAERQDQHPTLFTRIDLLVLVSGVGLEGRSVQLLWDESGEKICPVAAMLRPAVPITVTCKVL